MYLLNILGRRQYFMILLDFVAANSCVYFQYLLCICVRANIFCAEIKPICFILSGPGLFCGLHVQQDGLLFLVAIYFWWSAPPDDLFHLVTSSIWWLLAGSIL